MVLPSTRFKNRYHVPVLTVRTVRQAMSSLVWAAILVISFVRWALPPIYNVLSAAPSDDADDAVSGSSRRRPAISVDDAPSVSTPGGEKCTLVRPVGEDSAGGASPGQGGGVILSSSQQQPQSDGTCCASPESLVSGGGPSVDDSPATPDQVIEGAPAAAGDAAASPAPAGASVDENEAEGRSLEVVKAELEELVGLQEVKTWVRKLEVRGPSPYTTLPFCRNSLSSPSSMSARGSAPLFICSGASTRSYLANLVTVRAQSHPGSACCFKCYRQASRIRQHGKATCT